MSENKLLDKLKGIKIRFEEVGQQITDPEVIAGLTRNLPLSQNCTAHSIILKFRSHSKIPIGINANKLQFLRI
jgi:peptide chain release factor 1